MLRLSRGKVVSALKYSLVTSASDSSNPSDQDIDDIAQIVFPCDSSVVEGKKEETTDSIAKLVSSGEWDNQSLNSAVSFGVELAKVPDIRQALEKHLRNFVLSPVPGGPPILISQHQNEAGETQIEESEEKEDETDITKNDVSSDYDDLSEEPKLQQYRRIDESVSTSNELPPSDSTLRLLDKYLLAESNGDIGKSTIESTVNNNSPNNRNSLDPPQTTSTAPTNNVGRYSIFRLLFGVENTVSTGPLSSLRNWVISLFEQVCSVFDTNTVSSSPSTASQSSIQQPVIQPSPPTQIEIGSPYISMAVSVAAVITCMLLLSRFHPATYRIILHLIKRAS